MTTKNKNDEINTKQEIKNDDNSHEEYLFMDESVFVLPLIIKADVAGTLEAIENEISNIQIDNVKLKIISNPPSLRHFLAIQ